MAVPERRASPIHCGGVTREFKGCAKAKCPLERVAFSALGLAPKSVAALLDNSAAAGDDVVRSVHEVTGQQFDRHFWLPPTAANSALAMVCALSLTGSWPCRPNSGGFQSPCRATD